MMRPVVKNSVKILALVSALFLFAHCGVNGGNSGMVGGAPGCSPNVIDSGLQISMEPVSTGSNEYTVTLCANSQPANAVYSVYGGMNKDDVDATQNQYISSSVRYPNSITATNNSGSSFQVTFHGSDNFFAIYSDGSFQAMVSPHRIPGR